MSVKSETNTLLDDVNRKINKLAEDFQNNKLSREQFNLIYSRYNRQLGLALSIMAGDETDSMSTNAMKTMSTIRAGGGAIYHQSSNLLLDTLGEYTLEAEDIQPILSDFNTGNSPKLMPFDEQWLIVLAGNLTTIVLEYDNRPSEKYFTNLERLMADFENANQHLLGSGEQKQSEYAQPFICAVKSLK